MKDLLAAPRMLGSGMLSRRSFLASGTALSAAGLLGGPAHASVALALSLTDLVRQSDQVLVGTPLDSLSQWETIGGRNRIVTLTTVRLDRALDGRKHGATHLLVRTLGGRVDDIGQIVPGEAALTRGQAAVTFLSRLSNDSFVVTGLAQGHYRLVRDANGVARLRASGGVALVGRTPSAARALEGHTPDEVEALVRRELSRAP